MFFVFVVTWGVLRIERMRGRRDFLDVGLSGFFLDEGWTGTDAVGYGVLELKR